MKETKQTKLIHEGQYVAEVEISLTEEPQGWEPYLSAEDARKLDDVRRALKAGDLKTAAGLAKVFTLTPVTT